MPIFELTMVTTIALPSVCPGSAGSVAYAQAYIPIVAREPFISNRVIIFHTKQHAEMTLNGPLRMWSVARIGVGVLAKRKSAPNALICAELRCPPVFATIGEHTNHCAKAGGEYGTR